LQAARPIVKIIPSNMKRDWGIRIIFYLLDRF
jgi:hypothetical protein